MKSGTSSTLCRDDNGDGLCDSAGAVLGGISTGVIIGDGGGNGYFPNPEDLGSFLPDLGAIAFLLPGESDAAGGLLVVERIPEGASDLDAVQQADGTLAFVGGQSGGGQFGSSIAVVTSERGETLLAVGAPGQVAGEFQTPSGAVYLFTQEQLLAGAIDGRQEELTSVGSFGWTLAAVAGQEGVQLLVGAPTDSEFGDNSGRIDLLTLTGDGSYTASTWYGEASSGHFGESLLTADIDGDGVSEAIVGAPSTSGIGSVYVFSGPFIQFGSVDDASAQLIGEAEGDRAGAVLRLSPHVDGGTRLAISAPSGAEGGVVYVVAPSARGALELSESEARLVAEDPHEQLGRSLAWLDEDMLLVGAPGALGGLGSVYGFSRPSGGRSSGDADDSRPGTEDWQQLGLSLSTGLDLDADGGRDFGIFGVDTDGRGAWGVFDASR